jgi:hypothetical protein
MERILAYMLGHAARIRYMAELRRNKYDVRNVFKNDEVLGICSLNKKATKDYSLGHIIGGYVYINPAEPPSRVDVREKSKLIRISDEFLN